MHLPDSNFSAEGEVTKPLPLQFPNSSVATAPSAPQPAEPLPLHFPKPNSQGIYGTYPAQNPYAPPVQSKSAQKSEMFKSVELKDEPEESPELGRKSMKVDEDREFVKQGRALYKSRGTQRFFEYTHDKILVCCQGQGIIQYCCYGEWRYGGLCMGCIHDEDVHSLISLNRKCTLCDNTQDVCQCCSVEDTDHCCYCCEVQNFTTLSMSPGPERQFMVEPQLDDDMTHVSIHDFNNKTACLCVSLGWKFEGCPECCEIKGEVTKCCFTLECSQEALHFTKENASLAICSDKFKCWHADFCCTCQTAGSILCGLFSGRRHCKCVYWPSVCCSGKGKVFCCNLSCNFPCREDHTPMELGLCGLLCLKAEAPKDV